VINRRRLVLNAIAAGLMAGSGLLLWSFTRIEPGVTAENFLRLHPGMTENEVDSILGQATGRLSYNGGADVSKSWEVEESAVIITFGDGATDSGTFFGKDGLRLELRPKPETWREKLKRWGLLP
jgi:hypothetical protein